MPAEYYSLEEMMGENVAAQLYRLATHEYTPLEAKEQDWRMLVAKAYGMRGTIVAQAMAVHPDTVWRREARLRAHNDIHTKAELYFRLGLEVGQHEW